MKKNHTSLRRGAFAAIVGALVAALGYYFWQAREQAEAPHYRLGKIERGSITATVSATGTLNPVISVQVGTQVSGQIKELFADFNSRVKKGQLVARIDPETFEYRVRQAQADAEAARSARGRAQVALANAQRDLARTRELVAQHFVSPADLDAKQAAVDVAHADARNADAVVAQREASLASAKVDLGRTEIRAPVDGVVIKRSVDVGQTVAASLQAPEIFVIAKDLRDMQVETSIDEADIGRIRVGERATFTVDAFPGRSFNGEVTQIRKSAQSVQNVVTYTVLVSAQNDAGQLMPGMTANVRIITDTRESVLKVPNAALRFRFPGEATAPAAATGGVRGSGDAGAGDGRPDRGGSAQLRERLAAELKLDAAQQEKLDPIFAEARSRYMALRELPEEQRAKAGAAIRAETRARIEAILTAEQQARYAHIVAEQGGRNAPAARGRIWFIDASGKPKAIDVRTGLSDGTATEIIGDGTGTELREGREVIVGVQGGATQSAPRGGPPRLFF